MFTETITKKILDDSKPSIDAFLLLELLCYPMLKNESDERVKVRLYVSVNGEVDNIIEQSWPNGKMPDVGIAMHFLESNSMGSGYGGDKEALLEDGNIDGLKESDIFEYEVALMVEVKQ